LQSEFNAYNSYVTANSLGLPLLPTGPADLSGISNIAVTQFHGAASAGTTGPFGLYSNANVELIPNAAITKVWTGSYWSLTFPVTGFSGFFIHSGTTPLAIDLKSISAVNIGHRNRIDWSTAAEKNGDYFELERSGNATDFSRIATIAAKGSGSNYSYWDENPVTGLNYYRLKMFDAAGNSTYSRTVNAVIKDGGFSLDVYPNPVTDILKVRVFGSQQTGGSVIVTDVSGKIVKSATMDDNKLEIDMKGFTPGVYILKYSDADHKQTIRINKD
jgi:hypothetical protein